MADTSKIFETILSEMSKAAKMQRTAVAKDLEKKYGVVAFQTTNATQRINHPELVPKLAIKHGITGEASFLGLPNKNGGYDIIPHGTLRGGYIGDIHDYGGGGYFFDSDFKGGHTYSPDQIRSIVPASINANGDIVKKGSFSLYSQGSRMAEEAPSVSAPKPAPSKPSSPPPVEQPVENPKEEPVIEQPREIPKEEPPIEQSTEPPKEEPVVEQPVEISKDPVVEQPTEIPKEEPVVEQPRELPKEEPSVEQPVEIPKEPKPNSEPIIEPAPEEPHQSVYNPDNTPNSSKDVYRFKQSKHLDDFRIKNDSSVSGSSVQSEVDAANPLGTQASREAETAEAQARMADQGGATSSHEEGGGFFNSVKSSVTNLKATAAEKFSQAAEAMGGIKTSVSGKFDEAMEAMGGVKSFASEKISHGAETLGGIKSSVAQKVSQAEEAIEGFKAKYSSTPTEFQQQTTEMVNKFSGGKYTGAVDTENMNWVEAGANKHLHKSVAQDYQNLMAKMQGAKDQEAFSKLMEETGINYKEGMSGAELEKNINAHFDKRIADGPGIGNYMLGNKVAGGAMLTVSGASVLALSDSRGRRSNSDLYSSQI